MTYLELLEEVYVITNRRDLTAETKSAVKAATLKMHSVDFFSKDIYETGVSFGSSDYRQSLDYISIIPNYRALKYVRIVQDQYDSIGRDIEIITPDELLDSYSQQRNDIAYVAGRVLEIRASVSFDKLLVGAYASPIITESGYSSWVAALSPFAIIYEACRLVFKAIGQDEQSATFGRLVGEEVQLLISNHLSDVGS